MNEAKNGPDLFFQQRCPVNTCTIVRDNPSHADLVIFKDYISYPGTRPPNQVKNVIFELLWCVVNLSA